MSAPRTFRLGATAIVLVAAVVALVFLVPSFARPQVASAQVCGVGTTLVSNQCVASGYNGGCGALIFGYNCGSNCNGVNGYVASCSTYSNCSLGSFYSYQSLGCGGSNCLQGYSVACTSNCGYQTYSYNQSCGTNNASCLGGSYYQNGVQTCSSNTSCPGGYIYQNGVQTCSSNTSCPGGYIYQNGVQTCSSNTSCPSGYVYQNGVQTCSTASTSGTCTQYSSTTGQCTSYGTSASTSGTCTQYSPTTGQCVSYGTSASATSTSAGTGCSTITLVAGQTCSNGAVTCANQATVAAGQPCPTTSTTTASTLSSTAASVSATYVAGWNLVAAPGGTTIAGATGPMYTLQPGDSGYETIQNGAAVKAGQGYWAYFTSQMVDPIPLTTGGTIMIQLLAGSAVMIGNSGSTTATVSGADSVVVYDPVTSTYPQVTTLKPGQGGWAFSKNGAGVTISNQAS